MLQNEKQQAAADTAKDTQPMRLRVLELPTPPELAKEIKDYCHEHGIWDRKGVRMIEEELKLQYHFGGKHVACLVRNHEVIIVAVGDYQSEEYKSQLARLSPKDRRSITQYT